VLQGYHNVVVPAVVDAINNHHSGAVALSGVIGRSLIRRYRPISIMALSAGGIAPTCSAP